MPDRDLPLSEKVASRLHQLRISSVSGPGRRPDILKKSWDDLEEGERNEYYEEILLVVRALQDNGFIVDLRSRYQILQRRTNPLKVAIKKMDGIVIKER